MKRRKFNCTQQELYTICKRAWENCLLYLALFTAFKSKYTSGFITTNLSEVDAAKALPDDMQRTEAAKVQHILLQEKTAVNTNLFLRLKRYIADSFPESQHESLYESAGQMYYAAACNYNWDAIEGLNSSATNFIAEHEMELSMSMPPTFAGQYTYAKSEFEVLHQDFVESEERAKIQTLEKLDADNDIYTKMMSMFADAQIVLAGNDAILDQFNFTQLKFLVSGAGKAGLRGLVSNAVTGEPVRNIARVKIGFNMYDVMTNADGHYVISPMTAGIVTGEVTAPGFKPLTFTHEITTGTLSTLDFELEPEV